MMTISEQEQHFTGCKLEWYPKVSVTVPSGKFMDKKRFNVEYGGHAFQIRGGAETTASAWQAFTRNFK